jgi:hypothetical protein
MKGAFPMVDARRYTNIQSMVLASVVIIAALVAIRLITVVLAQSGGDSPVKVRGGAMTFRTSSGGDQFQTVGGSGNSFCILLSKTPNANVTLDVSQAKFHKVVSSRSETLTNTSQIDFFGRNEKGQAGKSSNGIRVLITPSCNGVPGTSALIQPEGPNSGLYLNQKNAASQDLSGDDLPNPSSDKDTSQSLRFKDLDCAAKFSPPTPGGDEDLCENMGLIIVNSKHTDNPTTTGKPIRCHNGDCQVEFNVQ